MAGCTIINYALVIKHCRRKASTSGMAQHTIVRSRNMRRISPGVHSSSIGSIVAAIAAITGDGWSTMIEESIYEAADVMTG